MVALAGYGDRKPSELSGGQRQRVALARALVNKPKALLLDEPLGALDLKLREQMQEELKTLQRSLGITFIFVTHDQGEALSMADRVAVFNEGRIVQIGAPEDDLLPPGNALRGGFRRLLERVAARIRSETDRARRPMARLRPEAVHLSGDRASRDRAQRQFPGGGHPGRH